MTGLIGQFLGQYEITARLGVGGMATVYRARQASMSRDVAIKVIKPDLAEIDDFMTRFEREARTVAGLSHPHILKVFDYGHHEDLVYLVMELLTGGNLAQVIRKAPLSLRAVGTMLDQIASALDYAHSKTIIHRDLKPQNVLLDEAGNGHLTDFGIAKILSETTELTQSGVAMGTPAYMAPEQWQGQALDARADVYALGIMLFEMLSGALPFKADTPATLMFMHLQQSPPSIRETRTDLPPSVELVMRQVLAKNREERFSSAGELAAAFKAALEEDRPPTKPPVVNADTKKLQIVPPSRINFEATLAFARRNPSCVLRLGVFVGIFAVLVMSSTLLLTNFQPQTVTGSQQLGANTNRVTDAYNTLKPWLTGTAQSFNKRQTGTAIFKSNGTAKAIIVGTQVVQATDNRYDTLTASFLTFLTEWVATQNALNLTATATLWTPTPSATTTPYPTYTATASATRTPIITSTTIP